VRSVGRPAAHTSTAAGAADATSSADASALRHVLAASGDIKSIVALLSRGYALAGWGRGRSDEEPSTLAAYLVT